MLPQKHSYDSVSFLEDSYNQCYIYKNKKICLLHNLSHLMNLEGEIIFEANYMDVKKQIQEFYSIEWIN